LRAEPDEETVWLSAFAGSKIRAPSPPLSEVEFGNPAPRNRKMKKENPQLKKLIQELEKRREPIWRAVARDLARPRRIFRKVNVYKLEKYANSGEEVVVPGVVLGTGELKKPVKVAAFKFSRKAREKIEKAGGRCLSILELLQKNPKGSGVRILG